jgi:hypothetical protein
VPGERGRMKSIRLVITKCPECGVKLIAVKGNEVQCESDNCRGFIKHAYSGEEYIVAMGGKKGLVIAPVKKEEEG